jgi:hypothetical protein
MRRDNAIRALYQASAALQAARDHTSDPVIAARIRETAHDVLVLIGKLAMLPSSQRADLADDHRALRRARRATRHQAGAAEVTMGLKTWTLSDGTAVIDLGSVDRVSAEEWEMLGDRCLVDARLADTKPERAAESNYLASRCYIRAAELRRPR